MTDDQIRRAFDAEPEPLPPREGAAETILGRARRRRRQRMAALSTVAAASSGVLLAAFLLAPGGGPTDALVATPGPTVTASPTGTPPSSFAPSATPEATETGSPEPAAPSNSAPGTATPQVSKPGPGLVVTLELPDDATVGKPVNIVVRIVDTDGTLSGGSIDFGNGARSGFSPPDYSCGTRGPYTPRPLDQRRSFDTTYDAPGRYVIEAQFGTDGLCQETPRELKSAKAVLTVLAKPSASPSPTPSPTASASPAPTSEPSPSPSG